MRQGRAGACGLALLVLAVPAAAAAQAGVSVSLASDERLRGLSLTDRRPALSLSLSWDNPAGVYAGASLTGLTGLSGGPGPRLVGHSEYLGVTVPFDAAHAWDFGVSNVDYKLFYERQFDLQYTEIYVGLVERDLSAHVYFAPDYPRKGLNSGYVDVDATHRVNEVWRFTGHLGAHERLGGTAARDGRRWRYDTRLSVAREFTRSELELSWTASLPDPLPHPSQSRPGLALAAKYFF